MSFVHIMQVAGPALCGVCVGLACLAFSMGDLASGSLSLVGAGLWLAVSIAAALIPDELP